MKIILLYGPGEIGKREEALKLRKHFPPEAASSVDLKTENLPVLERALISPSLFFVGKRLVVAENVPEKLDLSILTGDSETTLLLLSGSLKKDSPLLKSAQKAEAFIRAFEDEEEVSVFPFLDNLIERKPAVFVELDKLMGEYGAMYILTMIFYALRRNILPLPESSFMQKKISRQKAIYELKDWQRLYKLTLQTEFALKNGAATDRIALSSLVQSFLNPTLLPKP